MFYNAHSSEPSWKMHSDPCFWIVENIGSGIARNISFTSSRPVPAEAFGFADAPVPKQMTKGPIVFGIPVLHPGERRIITWGQYHGIQKGLENEAVDITAAYSSSALWSIRPHKHSTVSTIDLRSLEGTDASDGRWDKKAVEHLERISKVLERVAGIGSGSLRVVVTRQEESS